MPARRNRGRGASDLQIAALALAEMGVTFERYLPRILRCLAELSDEEIWWRPNEASNSAGNLVLHLCGNIRQWIISGLGGAPDVRERDKEFAERGPVGRGELTARLRATVGEARRVIRRMNPEALRRKYVIQGFHMTGLGVLAHVTEHFSHHAGQIIYIAKLKRGQDLRFTRQPAAKPK